MSEEKKNPLPPVGCVRVADVGAGTVPPEGVTVTACDGCGHEVYISPSSREMVGKGICRPVCYPCVLKMAEAGTRFTPTMTEAQLADLERMGAETERKDVPR
jgi:hypothetical protein